MLGPRIEWVRRIELMVEGLAGPLVFLTLPPKITEEPL